MRKKSLLWLSLGLLAIFAIWKIFFDAKDGLPDRSRLVPVPKVVAAKPSPLPHVPSRDSLPGQPALAPVTASDILPEERSPLADRLNAPDQPVKVDLEIVYNLINEYRGAMGAFPTGEDNAQIVNALSGNNPKKLAFLPRDSPAINDRGELIDRWGSPFFFHVISSQEVEIRSAGGDRELYTADDAIRRR